MSTQKAKFELFRRLGELGFSYNEAVKLRRIEMTLHRWSEGECGDANGNCIERDETTGKPFRTYEKGNGKRGRYPIADREAGAIRRLNGIMRGYPELVAYHQGDCRGCMLYILRKSDLNGAPIDQCYTRGLAVCA